MTEKDLPLTVAAFAAVLSLPKEELMLIFQACNIFKRNFDSFVSPEEVQRIEAHLEAKKASKQIQEIKEGQTKRRVKFQITSGVGGKTGTVQVEIRKKRRAPPPAPSEPKVEAPPETGPEALPFREEFQRPQLEVVENQLASDAPQGNLLEVQSSFEPTHEPVPVPETAADAPSEPAWTQGPAHRDSEPSKAKGNSASAGKGPSKKLGQHAKPASKTPVMKKGGAKNFQIQIPSSDEEEGEESSSLGHRRSKTSGRRHKNHAASAFRRAPAGSELKQKFQAPVQGGAREIKVREGLTVAEFAEKLSVKANWVIKEVMKLGLMARLNDVIEKDVMELVATNLGHQLVFSTKDNLEEEWLKHLEVSQKHQAQEIRLRPPVVTVMGHVDHGKTSLLDAIRKTCVAAKEAGGITQQMGAYVAEVLGREVVFIDTPGHEMFTSMRMRGAQVTDIAVIVVAIDDGLKPQTIEALQHAKAAGVPIIIAVTKVDKVPPASRSLQAIQEALLSQEVVVEAWGGETQVIEISAKTTEGIPLLMEAILLQADCLELKANYSGMFEGVVIESKIERGMGPVATLITKFGTLKRGDRVLCGPICSRIRMLKDSQGRNVNLATPSMPVAVYGLPDCPLPGEWMYSFSDEKFAKELAEQRQTLARNQRQVQLNSKERIEAWKAGSESDKNSQETTLINVVLKTDTYGSLEALKQAIEGLNTLNDFRIQLRGYGVGGLTEGDVSLAAASEAILIGFNVRADAEARAALERFRIVPQYHQIIYAVLDSLKSAIVDRLAPVCQEVFKGAAEVRAIFRSPKFGLIAGCIVLEGSMVRKAPVRIIRNQVVIYSTELDSLRRGKEDVQEVKQGNECGIGIKQYSDVKIGDRIEVYEIKEIARNPFEKEGRG